MQHADQKRTSKVGNGLAIYGIVLIGLLVTATMVYACLNQGLFFPSTWHWISVLFPSVLLVLWLMTVTPASNTATKMYNDTPIILFPLFIGFIYAWHLLFGDPQSINGTRDSLVQFFFRKCIRCGLLYPWTVCNREKVARCRLSADGLADDIKRITGRMRPACPS